ncbi:MAG: hypothetical protein AB7I13_05935 [Vicinamibacterales bacterium]
MNDLERLEALTLEDLAELDDSILVDAGAQAKGIHERWAKVRGRIDGELIRRMQGNDARLAVGLAADATLEQTRSYTWDVPRLSELARPLMTPALWDQYVEVVPPKPPTPTYKVNTRGLLGFASKIGRAGDVIHECYTVEASSPKVRYAEKEAAGV